MAGLIDMSDAEVGLEDAAAASSCANLAALSSFTLAALSSQHCFSCAGRLRHCQNNPHIDE
jgi:hypothetical protein